jgi:hypothetical protein
VEGPRRGGANLLRVLFLSCHFLNPTAGSLKLETTICQDRLRTKSNTNLRLKGVSFVPQAVTATLHPTLNKYFFCVTAPTTHPWANTGPFDTYILEAPALTGPFSLVSYMPKFGMQAYFVCESGSVLSHFYINPIFLPRQARDKHRQSTQKRLSFSQVSLPSAWMGVQNHQAEEAANNSGKEGSSGGKELSESKPHGTGKRMRIFRDAILYCTANDRFYQDRLGTNIGKTQKERCVFLQTSMMLC